jgi:hypothetical protein
MGMRLGAVRSGIGLGSRVVEGVAVELRVKVRSVVDVEGMKEAAWEPPAAVSRVPDWPAALDADVFRGALGVTFRHGTRDGGRGSGAA